jgi:hypothetical protein
MAHVPTKNDDQYSDKKTAQRRDAVIKRMLNTPPKPHSEMRVGKPRAKPKTRRPRNAPRYSEPMVIIGIERRPDGAWATFRPYLLRPDGSMESLRRSNSA